MTFHQPVETKQFAVGKGTDKRAQKVSEVQCMTIFKCKPLRNAKASATVRLPFRGSGILGVSVTIGCSLSHSQIRNVALPIDNIEVQVVTKVHPSSWSEQDHAVDFLSRAWLC